MPKQPLLKWPQSLQLRKAQILLYLSIWSVCNFKNLTEVILKWTCLHFVGYSPASATRDCYFPESHSAEPWEWPSVYIERTMASPAQWYQYNRQEMELFLSGQREPHLTFPPRHNMFCCIASGSNDCVVRGETGISASFSTQFPLLLNWYKKRSCI